MMRQAKEKINRSVQGKDNILEELNFYHKWCCDVEVKVFNCAHTCITAGHLEFDVLYPGCWASSYNVYKPCLNLNCLLCVVKVTRYSETCKTLRCSWGNNSKNVISVKVS